METKSKIFLSVILALLVAIPLLSAALATATYAGTPKNASLKEKIAKELLEYQRGQAAKALFKGAEAVTIQGTVITHFRNILVVTNSSGARLNILLPQVWSVNSEDEAFNVTTLFTDYVKAGNTVTIKVLERSVNNGKGVTITTILAYEITVGTNHLYAITPFNINP